jgi:serine/threonine protein phosphatase PrpC
LKNTLTIKVTFEKRPMANIKSISSHLINIYSYSHQGKRTYQEDSHSFGDNFLLVSDGVGGMAKGEIASDLVTDIFSSAIKKNEITHEEVENDIGKVVGKILLAMISYAGEHPESWGMGATLALLLQLDDSFFSIHIGDSKVYHFGSDGVVKWRSKDHSLVQELVSAGIIKESDAHDHPRKNIITRVLQAKEDHRVRASIHELENVVQGDRFLVCSDGVIESWTDAGLSSLFSSICDNEDIIREIEKFCASNSSDNNTAIIAKVWKIETVNETTLFDSDFSIKIIGQCMLKCD